MTKIANQTGRIIDAISVGPIEGLVDGSKSVFLDDTPVTKKENVLGGGTTGGASQSIKTTASVVQNSNIVKIPKTGVTQDVLNNFASFPRYIFIEGVGREINLAQYGGTGGLQSGQKGLGNFGGSQSFGLLTYPFKTNTTIAEGGDPLYDTLFEDNRSIIFNRERLDIEKYYQTGEIAPQTEQSKVKQTFTVNISSEGNNINRRHFFTHVSGYIYRQLEEVVTVANPAADMGKGASTSDSTLSFDIGYYFNMNNSNNSDIKAADLELTTQEQGNSVGRIGLYQFAGVLPNPTSTLGGVTISGTGGDWEVDYIRMDGTYRILSIQESADPSFLDVEIDTSTIANSVVPRPPTNTLNNQIATIFSISDTSPVEVAAIQSTQAIRGSVAFKTGERYQNAIKSADVNTLAPRTNVIINPNTTLLQTQDYRNGTSASTIYTSSGSGNTALGLSGLQAKQVDAIRLNVIFPNGLYIIQKNGDYHAGIVELLIKFSYRANVNDAFTTVIVRGTEQARDWWYSGYRPGTTQPSPHNHATGTSGSIDDGVGGTVNETKKGIFSKEVEFDVREFQPFSDFQVEIERQSPDNFDHYQDSFRINNDDDSDNQVKQFTGSAVVQYVQALFFDRFQYPLTAYAAVTFSGSDFDKIPTRAYHCRGLKIQVPSNYITREEDAALSGGIGRARYSRSNLGLSLSAGKQDLARNSLLTNQHEFVFTCGELNTTWAIPSGGGTDLGMNIGYWRGRPDPASTEPIMDIQPNIDDLIISFYNADANNSRDLSNISTIIIRFNKDYTLHGSTIQLYKNLTKVVCTDITNPADVITFDEVAAYRDEGDPAKTPVVTMRQSNYDAANPAITVGKTYKVVMTFNDFVVRPSNYVVWDGQFRSNVYCNNPAWVFYDLITNSEYGLGDYIKQEDVDIFELYEIARYCDELVPDGKGGLEPRFTCNVYLNKNTEAYQLVKDLASVFRGMTVWQNSKIIPIQDRPKSPVYLFTQANVIDGVFTYERQSVRAKPNSIEYTWNDPNQQYRQDVLILDDTENQLKIGRVIPKKIVAFGCTSKAQAKRVAEWHLATNQRESKRVTFATSINASLLQIGDVVSIQDQQANSRIKLSGRIASAPNADTLVLDREVTLDHTNSKYVIFIQTVDSIFICRQDSAFINGTAYSRGDVIKFDNAGNLLTGSTLRANEIVDDNNNLVMVERTKRASVIQKEVLPRSSDVSDVIFLSSPIELLLDFEDSITNSQGLVDSPDPRASLLEGNVWAIARNSKQSASIEKYRVMSIKPDAKGFNSVITGILYDESKFSSADVKNSAFEDPFFDDELAATVISTPENGTAALVNSLTNT